MPAPTTYETISHAFAAYLTAGGFGVLGTSLFLETMPDFPTTTPDEVYVLTRSGGQGQDGYHGPQKVTINVSYRGAQGGMKAGTARMDALTAYLVPANNLTWLNYRILALMPMANGAAAVGRDAKNRTSWSLPISLLFFKTA
ncbi:MAG: minor capsid protein [Nocardioides sp.]|jgi:hypothetical protein